MIYVVNLPLPLPPFVTFDTHVPLPPLLFLLSSKARRKLMFATVKDTHCGPSKRKLKYRITSVRAPSKISTPSLIVRTRLQE